MTEPWKAERTTDVELARALVASQFPDLAGVPIEPFGEGWDNVAYLAGGMWLFRFPRRAAALPCNEREPLLLPWLAPRVPLAVPVPEQLGVACDAFPWPFAGYRLLPGRTACAAQLDDAHRIAAAAPLAQFLAALHAISVDDAKAHGMRPDDIRKMDVAHRGGQARRLLADLHASGRIDAATLAALLAALDDTPSAPSRANVLVHGDLYALHVLVDDAGAPSGVIDWGDSHLGDPAVDLSIAHMLLPPQAHAPFRAAYGDIDDVTWRRARFRAIAHTSWTLTYAHSTAYAGLAREGTLALSWIARAVDH